MKFTIVFETTHSNFNIVDVAEILLEITDEIKANGLPVTAQKFQPRNHLLVGTQATVQIDETVPVAKYQVPYDAGYFLEFNKTDGHIRWKTAEHGVVKCWSKEEDQDYDEMRQKHFPNCTTDAEDKEEKQAEAITTIRLFENHSINFNHQTGDIVLVNAGLEVKSYWKNGDKSYQDLRDNLFPSAVAENDRLIKNLFNHKKLIFDPASKEIVKLDANGLAESRLYPTSNSAEYYAWRSFFPDDV